MKGFQPPVDPQKTGATRIGDLPPLPEMSHDNYDADNDSDAGSDVGGAEGKPPISLKQTEFSLKQVAQRIGQVNYSALN